MLWYSIRVGNGLLDLNVDANAKQALPTCNNKQFALQNAKNDEYSVFNLD